MFCRFGFLCVEFPLTRSQFQNISYCYQYVVQNSKRKDFLRQRKTWFLSCVAWHLLLFWLYSCASPQSLLISPPPPTFRIPIQRRTLGAKDWTSISASRTCGNLVSAYYKCNWPLLKLWACHAEKQKGNQLLHQHQSARLRLLTLAPSAAARPEVWRPRGSGFPTTASPLPEGRWVCPAAFPFPMTLHS